MFKAFKCSVFSSKRFHDSPATAEVNSLSSKRNGHAMKPRHRLGTHSTVGTAINPIRLLPLCAKGLVSRTNLCRTCRLRTHSLATCQPCAPATPPALVSVSVDGFIDRLHADLAPEPEL